MSQKNTYVRFAQFVWIILSVAFVSCSSANRLTLATSDSTPTVETHSVQSGDPHASSLFTFSPDETWTDVDPESISIRQVFDDLGEDATEWYQHVQTLANPYFEGRAPGTRGIELAADYLEFYFESYGLEPAFTESSSGLPGFRQNFDFQAPFAEVEVASAQLSVNDEIEDQDEYVILSISGDGSVTAPVTFVGYGIDEGKDGYSSFNDSSDLTGRIALLLRYEPLDEKGESQWSDIRFSRHAAIATKMKNVAKRGAAGILLVNPPDALYGKSDLESLESSARFGSPLEIPVFQTSESLVERILGQGDHEGRDLMTWRRLADTGEVKTFDLSGSLQVTLESQLTRHDQFETDNVAAYLPGRGSLADQWIVIGAHYDHLGYGYTGTFPDNVGKLHPGADDNASGTAGVLLAAKRLAEEYERADEDANLRSVMFVAFSAEESGLHGSKYFVENSPIPLDDITLMMNMDMIGMLRSNTVAAGGIGTAEEFDELLQTHFDSCGLTITTSAGGLGPSDHSNFYTESIPVLFFFTGLHKDYHRPTDLAHIVNPAGAVKIIDLLVSIVLDVADNPKPLTYVATSGGNMGRVTGANVRLGIMPGYTAKLESGVLVEAVFDGTSAAEGGIQKDDVLLTWDGEEITGGQKLAELLREHEPGDRVQFGIQRGEDEVILDITLKARSDE